MRSIGIGTSGNSSGMGSGMMPKTAYFAQMSATRAAIGIGMAMPEKSIMSITLVRSSPVTVMLPGWPFCPPCTSTLVTTPSNSGCGLPLRVTISTTRSGGVPILVFCPTAIRKMVFNSDLLFTLKLS